MAPVNPVVLDYTQSMQTRFIDTTSTCFISMLESVFSDSTTPAEFLYIPTTDASQLQNPNSKISIYRAYPRRFTLPNTLIVSITGGSLDLDFLGATEQYQELRDPVTNVVTAVAYGGKARLTVQIDIICKSVDDRDRLSDIVALYVRHIFRNRLAVLGIAYNKIRWGGQNQTEQGTDLLYTNSLIIEVYNEYYQNFPVALIENINALSLTVTPVLTIS